MTNFLEALNTRVSEIEKPPLMPVGTYVWIVHKPHRETTSRDGKWLTVEIPCLPKMAYEDAEDVDVDELAAYGPLKQGANSIRFMLDTTLEGDTALKSWLFNIKRFLLDTLRVDGDEDATVKELLAKMVGCEFVAQAAHRADKERDAMFCDVKNWAPLD
jgi:hypothetical protein